ncbi:MAG: phenylacetate-CoA oxygenase subunit PaaC [Bacteroidia bacterium]|nr:phenylacetate-CoA oxygenase subunit PaaC [Bacteroidia bacterium]
MNYHEAFFKYLLILGDTSLILAQRLSEWTGHGPFLEEDLALTNIALDTLGHANVLLEYAGKVENKGRDQDKLAFFRNGREYFNVKLVELPNGDYANTMVRQLFVDAFRYHYFNALCGCKDETLSGLAQKAVKEIKYHYRHSSWWIKRFGDGTEESHQRTQNALNNLWRFTGELFMPDESEKIMEEEKIAPSLSQIQYIWNEDIQSLLKEANLTIPKDVYMQSGGKQGVHTEYLDYILAEMQSLPRMYPDAKW